MDDDTTQAAWFNDELEIRRMQEERKQFLRECIAETKNQFLRECFEARLREIDDGYRSK